MKKHIQFEWKSTIVAFLMILGGVVQPLFGQSIVNFAPRTSTKAPPPYTGVQNYNLKGDFQMVGNSNMVATNDPNGTNASGVNNTDMKYVNVAPETGIVNSSSATLKFPTVAGVDPACTNIVYAGLYWSGRADKSGTASDTFTVTTGATSQVNTNVTNGNSSNGYTVTITSANDNSNGGNNGRLATYKFTPQGGGSNVVFKFYSWRTNNNNNSYTQKVTVQVGSGAVQTLGISRTSNADDNYAVKLNTPFQLPIGNGLVTHLRKRRTNNAVNNNFYATVQTPAVPGTTVNLDKKKVKFKFAGDSYQNISTSEILFPTSSYGYMYAGYSDVTDYVRQHGLGEYTVANIALREGKDTSTGYYGSWGLVVVYENPNLNRRSITVFDGYNYMAGGGGTRELAVSGFTTPPSGTVQATIAVMAGEGDTGYVGDTFSIQKKNTSTFLYLDHNGSTSSNATGVFNNFFNSGITIAGNPPRNPNHLNNYGSDIHMLNLNNTGNQIIGNSQTSTKFRYSSSQDTYIIYSIVFAVDSYEPEPTATVISGIPNGSTVQPGDQFTMQYDITNPGNEAVNNAKLTIPVPFNQEYVSSSVSSWDTSKLGPQMMPVFTPAAPGQTTGGTLTWNLGTLPLMSAAEKHNILASLKVVYKITSDCLLLSAPSCAATTQSSAYISGVGKESLVSVTDRPAITGYTNNACAAPTYNPFTFNLDIDMSSLDCNDNIIVDPDNPGANVVVYDTNANTVPHATVAADFPAGTKFYSKKPTDPSFNPSTDEVSGDFTAPAAGNQTPTRYYAVVPHMPVSCYITILIRRSLCFEDPNVDGTGTETKVGITLLKRAGVNNGNWPMIRKSGWLALESNTKGFVPSRLSDAQMNAIPATNRVEGMMIYNTTQNCLMIYTGTAWKCFNQPSCP